MFRKNNVLVIAALVAIVNAIGYGIIIPVLYSYTQKFGLTDFQNGLLFSVFSVCQFFATPVIGRLSDKYGRKPLLLLSIGGTALSFFLMAFAPSALFLFLARALDGITAGNIPVISAVISDTTKPEDRAKGFGIIGASFGFGFIFGPSISAITVGWNPSFPFIIAGAVSVIATIITAIFLPETNVHKGLVRHEKLIDFRHLIVALLDKHVGTTLLITFLYALAFSLFIYGYQPLSVRALHLTPAQISANFTLIGVIGLITQAAVIPRITKLVGERVLLRNALVGVSIAMLGFAFTRSLTVLIVVSIVHAFVNSFVNPLVQTMLSKEVESHSQGAIQGINASYMSIGMIIGPPLGGILATQLVSLPFVAAGVASFVCVLLSLQLIAKERFRQIAI